MKKLLKALSLRKAKYLKRTGSPGHYQYTYKEPSISRDRKTNEMVSYQGKQYRVVGRAKGYKGPAKMYDIATVMNGKTVIKKVPGSQLRSSRGKQAKEEKKGGYSKEITTLISGLKSGKIYKLTPAQTTMLKEAAKTPPGMHAMVRTQTGRIINVSGEKGSSAIAGDIVL